MSTDMFAKLSADRNPPGFSSDAKWVLHQYLDAGWRYRVTSNSLCICYAPDGEITSSIALNCNSQSERSSSLRVLHKWRRNLEVAEVESQSAQLIEQIRGLVAADLLAEREQLKSNLAEVHKELADCKARFSIITEALAA